MELPNRNSVNFLGNIQQMTTGSTSAKPAPDCDVCAVEKSHQLAHPETAKQKVERAFQLIIADLVGPFTRGALGVFNHVV